MNAPRIVRSADLYGRPIVHVELVTCLGVFATIDEADFDALVASGVSTRWYLNKPGRNQPGYVRADLSTVKGKIGTIARLILNAGQGEAVSYRNGCRYDLRRSNLVLNEGWAKARAPLPVEQVDEFAPSTLVPSHEAGTPHPVTAAGKPHRHTNRTLLAAATGGGVSLPADLVARRQGCSPEVPAAT